MNPTLWPATDYMDAITLWQPWASYIAEALKRYETRSWLLRGRYYHRPMAIHAAKRPALKDEELPDLGYEPPLGAIVAVAMFDACIYTNDWWNMDEHLTVLERSVGDFGPNRYAWRISAVVKLPEPIPYRGGRLLWKVRDPDTLAKLQDGWKGKQAFERLTLP